MSAGWILCGRIILVLLDLYIRRSNVSAQFGLNPPLVSNPDTTNIPVYKFQTKGYSSDKSYARFNGTIPEPLYSFTVCHRIQIHYERPRMYVFTYASSDENSNDLYSEYHLGRRGFRACKKGTVYCGWDRFMPPFYTWRHLCLVYDLPKDQFKVFADGEKVNSGSWSENPNAVNPDGVLILGQDQDNMGGGFESRQSFSGLISQFNIWNYALQDYEIETLAECRSDAWGNVVASKTNSFIISNEHASVETVPLFELCGDQNSARSKYFLFNDAWSYPFYKAWCYNMGGGLSVPESEDEYNNQMDIAEGLVQDIHEKCVHSSGSLLYWIGYTDSYGDGTWINPYTKDAIPFDGLWEGGVQPVTESCASTYIDRKWVGSDCSEGNCALCHFPQGMNLTIRGLCTSETNLMEGFFDTEYFLSGFRNGKPVWRGRGKSHIFFSPEIVKWKLESLYDVTKFATFAADDTTPYTYYPTGRNLWSINSGICAKSGGEEHLLSLTNCIMNDGSKTDFTCRDGTCIPIDALCNLVVDCPDRTDEENCDLLLIPEEYRGEKFPVQQSREPIKLYVNISIIAFPEVNTLELNYLVDFVLSMRWNDPRLNYRNLKQLYDLNALPMNIMEKMWTPQLGFPNGLQAEGTVLDSGTTMFIIKLGSSLPDDLSMAREAKMYNGEECPIVMKKEYFVKFNCDFELSMYPFDSNICKLQFEVSGIGKEYITLDIDNFLGGLGAEYTGRKELLEYRVGDVKIENLSNTTKKYGMMEVQIVFQRKWSYHLITVFLQSVFLLLVAYYTFFFRLSNFTDRIMISITCMLVISTIQSKIDRITPKTSYFKMIDFWLIYSFNIVILIMHIHTIINLNIIRDEKTNLIVQSSGPVSGVTKVRPMKDDIFEPSGRLSSAKSLANKMFNGSEDDEEVIDPYASARKANFYGQVFLILTFLLFTLVFWAYALNHAFNKEIRFYDDDGLPINQSKL
ncbi:uncharacterized protein LOC111707216 [Eurytemora carolleeae]|uniref:uncharacterized protein LOC111707216 n=1 Tax=Eurytemora carolleeae TaxID=1294199 RepID=UPI000C763374|nr:uncharacterized protein LOC111707216 [Eurytemora carolleeae]|eukprot:XP_023336040.1 uncharacterized protein LOC111707216 [Eurytemora affinis]